MCGITGGIAFNEKGKNYLDKIGDSIAVLRHRGPDGEGIFRHENVVLGHTRLAVIDTTSAAAQPFTSADGRYTIVLNGEIFNYRELKKELETAGVKFRSHSDTEVLLELYAKEKEKCLPRLNGFFAFAVHDKNDNSVFLARDRFGEKPLYYYFDTDVLLFASEVKALLAFGISRTISFDILADYLHLNYIPQLSEGLLEQTFFHRKATYTHVSDDETSYAKSFCWYIPGEGVANEKSPGYEEAKNILREKCEAAVTRRLVSDVPLGSFLSGGVDSSIVTAIASRHIKNLQTFSIGYADEKYFDETHYAELVSKHLGTTHHVFYLKNDDLLESLHYFFETLDEPFADSSALAVNILARETRRHVTVALSGDGADELFGGYNKHEAEFLASRKNLKTFLLRNSGALWNALPASRNSVSGNRIRQLRKFSEGLKLSPAERYWRWAGFTSGNEVEQLLKSGTFYNSEKRKRTFTSGISDDFNRLLRADLDLVLQGDMLVKVDRMSMLHALEVRPPFLDHEVVDFVVNLPVSYKIETGNRKKILKDAFRDCIPAEILNRQKQGFEVPLLKWFRNELSGMIQHLLGEKFLREQNIFNTAETAKIVRQLNSSNPGDSAARVWGLLVFQKWWLKNIQH